MPSQTPNMSLYKVNGETDGNDTFNVDVVLNDNWDKIDATVGQIQADLENIDVDIPDASLTQKGIVQLNDTLSSTSKTMAATADALRRVYEEATAGKQLGVEQKANVVAALNSIGVTATTGETWPQLITKIRAVIRATGTATAADILAGKSASNASGPITGTMPNRGAGGTVTPSTANQSKAAGYYSSPITILGDPDLIAANIRQGKDIFGVVGSLVEGRRSAIGTFLATTEGVGTVTGLSFRPKNIMVTYNSSNRTQDGYAFYSEDIDDNGKGILKIKIRNVGGIKVETLNITISNNGFTIYWEHWTSYPWTYNFICTE